MLHLNHLREIYLKVEVVKFPLIFFLLELSYRKDTKGMGSATANIAGSAKPDLLHSLLSCKAHGIMIKT